MNRKEVYEYIKLNNMSQWILTNYGKSYTNMSTELLENIISLYSSQVGVKTVDVQAKAPAHDDNNIEDIIFRLITVLKNKRIIVGKEAQYILGQ